MVTVRSAKLQSWNALTLSPNLPHWFFSDPFMEKEQNHRVFVENKHALYSKVTRIINSTLALHKEYQLVKDIRPSSPDKVKMLN